MDTLHIPGFVDEFVKVMGGEENMQVVFEQESEYINKRWTADTEAAGRILRAHLFVEHFLNEYLISRNPQLGSLDDARLTFSQKIVLITPADSYINLILPGIRQLNKIRNRLAHQLAATVTDEDAKVFLEIDVFKILRDELALPNKPSMIPIDILEDFSEKAGWGLYYACNKKGGSQDGMRQAINNTMEKSLVGEGGIEPPTAGL